MVGQAGLECPPLPRGVSSLRSVCRTGYFEHDHSYLSSENVVVRRHAPSSSMKWRATHRCRGMALPYVLGFPHLSRGVSGPGFRDAATRSEHALYSRCDVVIGLVPARRSLMRCCFDSERRNLLIVNPARVSRTPQSGCEQDEESGDRLWSRTKQSSQGLVSKAKAA